MSNWEKKFNEKFKDAALIYPKVYVENAKNYGFNTKIDLEHFKSLPLTAIKSFIRQREKELLEELEDLEAQLREESELSNG